MHDMKKKMQWFRMYVDMLNSAKVQILEPKTFKAWVNILCIVSNNDGVLPETLHETAFLLRVTEDELNVIIEELLYNGLLEEDDGIYSPHNWNDRQYKSDSSYERVRKYREKRKSLGLAAQNEFSKEKRKEIYKKDGNCCVYCNSKKDLTIDHMTPELRGGTNDISNLQTVCRKCNSDKRNMTHDEYVKWEGRVTFHVTEKTRPKRTETENRDRNIKERVCPSKSEKEEAFNVFYSHYPRKIGKKVALRQWLKLNPDEMQKALDVVETEEFKSHMRSQKRGTKDFRKHPSTWLTGGCWDDELKPVRITNGDPF